MRIQINEHGIHSKIAKIKAGLNFLYISTSNMHLLSSLMLMTTHYHYYHIDVITSWVCCPMYSHLISDCIEKKIEFLTYYDHSWYHQETKLDESTAWNLINIICHENAFQQRKLFHSMLLFSSSDLYCDQCRSYKE